MGRTLKRALLPFLSAAILQAQVSAPRVGLTRFGDGTVRAVFGLPGNLIVDPDVLFKADSASFSNSAGLIAEDGRVELVDLTSSVIGQLDSSDSSPLLSVRGGSDTAIVWLPSSRSLAYWNGTSFVQIDASPAALPGRVASLFRRGSQAVLMLSLPDGAAMQAVVSLENGNLISLQACPGITGPAFRIEDIFLFANRNGLEAQFPDGVVRAILPARDAWTVETISSNWLHIRSNTAGEDWALQVLGSNILVSRLPAPPANALTDSAAREVGK